MNKPRTIPLLVMSASAIASTIGYGSWIITALAERNDFIEGKPSVPVCYFQGNEDVLYTTIEKALSVAADKDHKGSSETIVVIPGSNPVISESCTLDEKDTLLIPYENETYMRDISKITNSDVSTVANANFADHDAAAVLANKKSEVTIDDKDKKGERIVFTNNGSVKIGGELGVGSSNQRPSGHTNGKYAQITIKDGATFENNGSLDIYGYIKKEKGGGTGKIAANASSSISMPLVIDDFKGGSYFMACNSQNIFPFNIFELVNCQCRTEFYAGAELKVRTAVYADNKIYVPDESKLISGSGALFSISSGKATLDYSSYSFPYTRVDNASGQDPANISRMNIGLDGKISLDSMSLSLAGTSIETGKFAVPLSYKFSLTCLSGSDVTIQKPTKFLSGSSITIEKNAALTFASSSIFYQTYVDQSTYVAGQYPKKLGSAKIINDGDLTLNSSFGGQIETSNSYGVLTTGSSFENSVKASEMISVASRGMQWTYKEITGIGFGQIKASESDQSTSARLAKGQEYRANEGSWVGQADSGSVTETIGNEKPGSCILMTALLLMADGRYKEAGSIRTGDVVMSFNHETGGIEPNLVIGNDDAKKEADLYEVVHLEFSDGNRTDFVYEHGYFDTTLNKYVYLHPGNAANYIGHEFISIDASLAKRQVRLIGATIRKERTKLCSPATAKHLNIIADGMLSLGGGLAGLFNIFEYDPETLAFDKGKMKADIQKYGLLAYKDFERFFPEEIYNLLPCKYLNVSIGKGLITWDIFEGYVNKWKDQLMENMG